MISMKHLAVALGIAGLAGAGFASAADEAKGRGCEGPQASASGSAGEHRHGHGMDRMAAMHGRMASMHGERHGQRHDHGAKQEEKKEESKQ